MRRLRGSGQPRWRRRTTTPVQQKGRMRALRAHLWMMFRWWWCCGRSRCGSWEDWSAGVEQALQDRRRQDKDVRPVATGSVPAPARPRGGRQTLNCGVVEGALFEGGGSLAVHGGGGERHKEELRSVRQTKNMKSAGRPSLSAANEKGESEQSSLSRPSRAVEAAQCAAPC